jgi:hypothetical protein
VGWGGEGRGGVGGLLLVLLCFRFENRKFIHIKIQYILLFFF